MTGTGKWGEPPDGFDVAVTDARRATAYLVGPGADEYIAIMAVLEASITDLTPAEVTRALREAGTPLPEALVETRLDQLRDWTAASARTDTSQIRTYADLRARNWRWTATTAGRQVQRFYTTVLAGTRRCGRSRCPAWPGSSPHWRPSPPPCSPTAARVGRSPARWPATESPSTSGSCSPATTISTRRW